MSLLVQSQTGKSSHTGSVCWPSSGAVTSEGPWRRLGSHVQCSLPFCLPSELQMMVEHHLGQQQEGEEPEGAAESTGTQESCPPGIGDTAAESWLGTSGKAHSTFRLGRDQPQGRPAFPVVGRGLAVARNCLESTDLCMDGVCLRLFIFLY